jgi:hypothetical protein
MTENVDVVVLNYINHGETKEMLDSLKKHYSLVQGMEKAVILFGAFERHNFGDMLMLYVFKKLLNKYDITAIPASLVESDMSRYGGELVYSLSKIIGNLNVEVDMPVIHVGGETLPVSKEGCLRMNIPNINLTQDSKENIIKIIGKNYDRSFGYITPATENIKGLQRVFITRIFYGIGYTKKSSNTVNSNLILRDLKDSCFLGLRDGDSVGNAQSDGLEKAEFTPDCVLLISDLWPVQKPSFLPDGRYVLVHFNQRYLHRHFDIISEQIMQIREIFDFVVIGVAGLAHDSFELNCKLKEILITKGVKTILLDIFDIHTITMTIACAQCVISTSLHYRIVAASYNVPRISLQKNKVTSWAKYNDPHYPYAVILSNIKESVISALQLSGNDSDQNINGLKRLSYNKIKKIIESILIPHFAKGKLFNINIDHASDTVDIIWLQATAQYLDLLARQTNSIKWVFKQLIRLLIAKLKTSKGILKT